MIGHKQDAFKILRQYGTLIVLLLLVIILSIATQGTFFSSRNLSNLAKSIVIIGSIAIGMTMVILMAGIDLSVGSIVALGGITGAYFSTKLGLPVYLVIPITLFLAGVIPGFINGFLSEKFRIHPFVITLGIMVIARGVTLIIAKGATIGITQKDFKFIGQFDIPKNISIIIIISVFIIFLISVLIKERIEAKHNETKINFNKIIRNIFGSVLVLGVLSYAFIGHWGMPFMFIIFCCIVLFGLFIQNQTKIGRYMYAIGGNNLAARLSGIKVIFPWTFGFITTSVIAAFSGMILAARLAGAEPNAGNAYELDVIAAVVVGGTSLAGGVGSIGGTLIGILLLAVVGNGMDLLGVGSYPKLIIRGTIVIAALIFDAVTKKVKS
ncbi:MAG: inner-membrane translocator [Spirochaetes bacterium]|nr:inner-membrane translocator [Spirochaetota bacterium]